MVFFVGFLRLFVQVTDVSSNQDAAAAAAAAAAADSSKEPMFFIKPVDYMGQSIPRRERIEDLGINMS